MRSLGSEGMGIDTIVASGPNTRPILARTRLRELRRDELILLTIAPRYEGYHAAIGRPLVIGQPLSDVRQAMEVALAAQTAARDAMHPVFGPGNHAPLQPDMVLSIDVPLFHAPWGGLRYEDGYLITATGAESLADVPSGVLTL
jgi:Xaa-Pro aminopeptidase